MSAVTDVLDRLISGQITTEQAAVDFSAMSWPTPQKRLATLAQIETDPDPEPSSGGFPEIEQSFVNGDITLDQYTIFVHAARKR